ncbi:hypothetical protein FACS1894102_5880 [Spirochaetia bacterium]|nr:hypothetical protein FACS1894102_5880 [Spirochaetia bacterium]
MGFGDCVEVCKFGALRIGENGIPIVDENACKGCKVCVNECPQGIIRIVEKGTKGSFAVCNNRNTKKAQVRKDCKTGCGKCGACAKACPNGALEMSNGLPVIDYAKCQSCGTCVEKCPQKVLVLRAGAA